MGDFISNNPDGKSDLHKFAPPTEPPMSQETPTAPSEQLPTPSQETPQQTLSQSEHQPTNPPASPQPAYQNPYQNASHDPYGYFYYGQQPPSKGPKDGYNTASMILGIVAWAGVVLCCGCFSPFTAIISIILAFMGRENGKFSGKAVAGIILSVSFLVIFPILFIVFLYVAEVEPSDSSGDLVEMMIAFIRSHH